MSCPALPTLLRPARIFLFTKDVDMRKSFDGLHSLVQTEFQRDIRLGDLFLFLNRRLDRIKALHWDGDGLVIWMKRLERGSFQRPRIRPDSNHVEMDATDLAILLAGIELSSVRRRPRYRGEPVRPEPTATSHNSSHTAYQE